MWDLEKDPAPLYKDDFEADDAKGVAETDDVAEETPEKEDRGSRQFAFEHDLQDYLVQNLGLLEPGLKQYEDEDGNLTGVEFRAGRGRIDILAVGTDGAHVVIETKVDRAPDQVIGQTLRYMGWIKQEFADEAPVRGIIVASKISDDLKLATSFNENIRLVEYEISFALKSVSGQ